MEVLFNLHYPDVFAIANSNVTFYQSYAEGVGVEKKHFSPQLFFTQDGDANADVKCMAWHPSSECSEIIALGQSNGRVNLISTNFLKESYSRSINTQDFVPKHARQCSGLAWNQASPYLLAIGLEKSKSGSLIVWDINSKHDFSRPSDRGKGSGESNPSPNSQASIKPLIETAQGDTVNSVMWLTETNLIGGFNKKYIRIYDIRMQSSSSSVINCKSTFGLSRDPTREIRFACYGDHIISVWDHRNYNKPVANIPTMNNVAKIEWNRKRGGMLGALFARSETSRHKRDFSTVHVYDMLNATHTDQDQQVGGFQPLQRTVCPKLPEGEWIGGFAWASHLKNNALLTVTNSLKFNLNVVPESTTAAWAGRDSFAIANGYNASLFKQEVKDAGDVQNEDTASLIYHRVLNKYGMSEDNFLRNIELSLQPDNPTLHSVWKFIDRIKKTLAMPALTKGQSTVPQSPSHWNKSRSFSTSKPAAKTRTPPYFGGVQNILKDDSENYAATQVETIPWIGVDNTKSKVFTSEKRTLALMMCDWGRLDGDGRKEGNRFGRNSVGEDLVRRLQKAGATERACAVAVWHLDIKLAIEILNLSLKSKKSSEYSAVAMALSGYTGSNCPTLWLDTCRQLQSELEDAYLQMAFAFLIACADESKNANPAAKFETILSNSTLHVEDRVAFACMYLPDIALNTYINSLVDDLIDNGRLEGIAIVGLSTKSGIALLQNYLNETRDIQTPLLAMVHTHQQAVLAKDQHVAHWRDSYRNLLNKWKLYFERVEFDLLWNRVCAVKSSSGQVYLHCNYCNKSISHSFQPRRGFGGGANQQNTITSCPYCRKPLPRCSVCSMHLGTRQDETDFTKWISWCMKCRHGGHHGHLKDWFENHRRCPVTDCKCFCNDDLPVA